MKTREQKRTRAERRNRALQPRRARGYGLVRIVRSLPSMTEQRVLAGPNVINATVEFFEILKPRDAAVDALARERRG